VSDTLLQLGMRVLFDGRPHVVVMVNECRAKLVPEQKQLRTITPKTGPNAGKTIQIAAIGDGHNISPNSELPRL